ncbi:MAG: site-specific integrase, partial [Planctomycetaceae bacterium]
RFHRTPDGTRRHPAELRGPEISAFLTYLAVDRLVSASTQNQALCAIVLLYRQVLELDPGRLDGVLATQRKPPAAAIVVDRRFPFNRSQPAPPFREFHIPQSSVAL